MGLSIDPAFYFLGYSPWYSSNQEAVGKIASLS